MTHAPGDGQGVTLQALRLGRWTDRTRLVIETNRAFDSRLLDRDNETAVAVELEDIDRDNLSRLLEQHIPAEHPLIRSYRIENNRADRPRLVLRLRSPAKPDLFDLQPDNEHGYRWVLDLFPSAEPERSEEQPASSPPFSDLKRRLLGVPEKAIKEQPSPDSSERPDREENKPSGEGAANSNPAHKKDNTDARHRLLRDVRLGRWPKRTRLVLESETELPFHLIDSARGERLSVVLDNVETEQLSRYLERNIPTEHFLIHHYRIDKTAPGSANLILDFNRPVRANIFNLAPDHGYKHRLVMDFHFGEAPTRSKSSAARPATNGDNDSKAAAKTSGSTGKQSGSPQSVAEKSPEPPEPRTETRELWLEAKLNEQPRSTILALMRGGELLLSRQDLQQWRLRVPATADTHHVGQPYFSMDSLGVRMELNTRESTLDLQAPPSLFTATQFSSEEDRRIAPTPSPLGAFFNYDLSATRAEQTSLNGLFEMGVFNGWGSGATSFVAHNDNDRRGDSLVRLETTWRRDFPDSMQTLRVGDTFTRGTGWSGAVRFGGIQWSTNFETQPELVTLPLLDLSGNASLPSTVELYVDDALRLRREVPPGPFTIDEVPVVSGSGQARLVVRDLLGREQVITRDFFASRRLLREGLRDYSLELGFSRQNFGVTSNDYDVPFAAATYVEGVSDGFTLEAHGQFLGDLQMVGLGGAWLLPLESIFHTAWATSRTEGESGHLTTVGLQHQGDAFNIGFESQFATEHFSRLDRLEQEREFPKSQWRAFASWSAAKAGSLGLSYTLRTFRRSEEVEFVSANYNTSLGIGYLGVSAMHFPGRSSTDLNLYFSIPLGADRQNASISANNSDGRTETTVQLQKSPPPGTGVGYRLQSTIGQRERYQGSLSYQNDFGAWQLRASRANDQSGVRANARGGLTWLDNNLYASRPINDSFAVVAVPGFSDVRVYADNQEVARTNAEGHALVPRLRSYERNRISIEQADLPLETRVGDLEKEVAPYYRSGIVVAFETKNTRDASLRITLESGHALPAGARVELSDGRRFPVGMNGEVFLMDVEPENTLTVHWQQQRCRIQVKVPDSDHPVPDIGEFTCEGVTR